LIICDWAQGLPGRSDADRPVSRYASFSFRPKTLHNLPTVPILPQRHPDAVFPITLPIHKLKLLVLSQQTETQTSVQLTTNILKSYIRFSIPTNAQPPPTPAPPPSKPLATTLLADTTLLRLFTAHTPPYINSALGIQAFI